MFNYVVRYLGFFKRIPFAAWYFDIMLFFYNCIFNREIIYAMDKIETAMREYENVSVSIHKYGGLQFNIGKKEIGHIHSNGLLDILFSRNMKEKLIAEGRATEHHVFQNSGWISFYVKNSEDAAVAVKLLKIKLSEMVLND